MNPRPSDRSSGLPMAAETSAGVMPGLSRFHPGVELPNTEVSGTRQASRMARQAFMLYLIGHKRGFGITAGDFEGLFALASVCFPHETGDVFRAVLPVIRSQEYFTYSYR